MRVLRRRFFALFSVTALLALAGCAGAPAAAPAAPAGGGTQTLEVVAQDLRFSPTELAVEAGRPVTIRFQNQGQLEHDWSILDIEVRDVQQSASDGNEGHGSEGHEAMMMPGAHPDVHVVVKPGHTGLLTFTPTKAGRYEFICTIAGHKDAGMKGTLTVQAGAGHLRWDHPNRRRRPFALPVAFRGFDRLTIPRFTDAPRRRL